MRRGVIFMVLAGLVFTVMISAVKVARESLHPLDLIFWRSLIATPLVLALARGRMGELPRPRLLLVRAVLGFAAMSCIFNAARGLSISDLSVLHKLQPIVVAMLAPWFLGSHERAGALWGAVLLGFAGAALLIGPELQVGNAYGLWAAAGAAFSALAHIAVRSLGRDHSPFGVVVAFQVSCVPLSVMTLWVLEQRWPVVPSGGLWLPVILIAAAAGLGQLLMTQAYKLERAAPVAAASYTAPLWGVLADLLWFSQMPSWSVWVGGSAIVAAGLWLVLGKSGSVGARPHPASNES